MERRGKVLMVLGVILVTAMVREGGHLNPGKDMHLNVISSNSTVERKI